MANADDTTVTNVVIPDDLTTTGAALSYVSNKAYLVNPGTGARTPLNGGAPLTLGASGTWLANHPGILSDATKHLVFSYENNPALASLPAGNNVEIDLTVVLDNNPTNVNLAGTQFTNTAKMWFDKPINSTAMVDLQAWPGTTLPMAIVEPNLTLTKTGSAATINVASQVKYTLNVQNTGGSDAWNTTITDNLPAGMCTYSPVPTVTAQIFASDGVTPVSAPLVNGTDYHAHLERRQQFTLPAHPDHARYDQDRPHPASDHHLPGPARQHRRRIRNDAYQYCRRYQVVQREQQPCRPSPVRQDDHRRHAGHTGFPGRLHRYGGAVRLLLPEDGPGPDHRHLSGHRGLSG